MGVNRSKFIKVSNKELTLLSKNNNLYSILDYDLYKNIKQDYVKFSKLQYIMDSFTNGNTLIKVHIKDKTTRIFKESNFPEDFNQYFTDELTLDKTSYNIFDEYTVDKFKITLNHNYLDSAFSYNSLSGLKIIQDRSIRINLETALNSIKAINLNTNTLKILLENNWDITPQFQHNVLSFNKLELATYLKQNNLLNVDIDKHNYNRIGLKVNKHYERFDVSTEMMAILRKEKIEI
jgi:hypothetical protein